MNIKTIAAKSFAGLKGQELEFKPGLNIVSGPNESGKSTWHAALYSMICGIRHKGGVRAEERTFKAKYLPWGDSDKLEVQGTILNDRGEVFTVVQDLLSSTGSQVFRSGKDVRAEFEHEGNPDMSSLIGLRRETFASVAVIRQGEILKIAEGENHALVDAVQSVASTAGAGGTAAAALDILANYKSEKVGTDKRNATKPLRRAVEAKEEAQRNLQNARSNNHEFTKILEKRDEAESKAELEGSQKEYLRLELEAIKIHDIENRIDRYQKEVEAFGSKESTHQIDTDGIANVNNIIAQWKNKKKPESYPTPTSEELRSQLDSIIDPIRDETVNIHDVSDKEIVEAVLKHQGLTNKLSDLDDEIERLSNKISDLSATTHQEEPTTAPPVPDGRNRKNAHIIFIGLALSMVGGFLSSKSLIPGLIVVALGISISLAGYLRKSRKPSRSYVNQEPTNNVKQSNPFEDEINVMQQRRTDLISEIDSAFAALTQVFESHEEVINDSDYMLNVANVIFRQKSAEIAKERDKLNAKINETLKHEEEITDINNSHITLYETLRKQSADCGILEDLSKTGDELVVELDNWLKQQKDLQDQATNLTRSRAIREEILNGETLDDLKGQIDNIRRAASSPLPDVTANRTLEVVQREIDEASRRENMELRSVSDFEGQIRNIRQNSLNVADCEQELEAAENELERVRALEADLDLAIEFLKDAEIDVNNDIAPIIQGKLSEYLPIITKGRYAQVIIDPGNLKVKVQIETGYKDAEYLSFGTAEQVYLVLRVALIEHLTGNSESCPIFCDDITVHADTERKGEILKFLLELSAKQQIILFSQEDFVRDWARENLQSDRDSLILLPAL